MRKFIGNCVRWAMIGLVVLVSFLAVVGSWLLFIPLVLWVLYKDWKEKRYNRLRYYYVKKR